MQPEFIVSLLIFISCSISLVAQCCKGKKSGSKKDVAAKPKETAEERKRSAKRKTTSNKKPNREEKKKTEPNKKYIKSRSFEQQHQKPNKWYHLQLLVPVTTFVLSPYGKRKKKSAPAKDLKEKGVKTAIAFSPKKQPDKFQLNKLKTAKAIESKRNETQLTALSMGHLPTVEKATSDGNAVNLVVGERIGNYKVTSRLGAGGCGVVYRVVSNEGKDFAMKVERTNVDKSDQLLPLEAHILKRLQFSPYAAQFAEYGSCQTKEGGFRVLIMGLLGPSLNHLQKEQLNGRFTMGTILKIGVQAVRAVAFMHCTYFVHRDIKPANFAIDEVNHKRLYLFDFGLARSIKSRGEVTLRKPRADVPFRGTPAYCSLNAHKRKEHGRHDDLWSIFYMLVELAIGRLPWQGKTRILTKLLKDQLMDREYMFGCPVAFSTILIYLRSLDYYKRPDYVGIEHAFFEMMKARKLNWNIPMDWEVNK
uniref:Protein kinase domain-containing protein n=1 Tax=Meloidogyne hapla TaxID=6305 RepID=A0A1I8AYY1_MELHA